MPVELFSVRTAAAANVRYSQRLVDVLAVPYDTPTPIDDWEGTYTETIDRGAFSGVERRANRVKVLRDHDPRSLVGVAHALYPNKRDGLHATLRVSRTPAGDDVLELASEGILDVSVGFTLRPDGSQWNSDRTTVLRTGLLLREISFVPFPAYEDAGVTGVRHVNEQADTPTSLTPNLDAIRALLAETRYAALNPSRTPHPS